MAPAAAEINPGRPPKIAVIIVMQNVAYTPTIGSTPATIIKPITSGINAINTTIPAKISPFVFPNHSCLKFFIDNLTFIKMTYSFLLYKRYSSNVNVIIKKSNI